jgi:hypothetical protein
MVDIPGTTIPRNVSRTPAISSPTARIFSRSFSDFAYIIARFTAEDTKKAFSFPMPSAAISYQVLDLPINFFNISRSVDFLQTAGTVVIIK